MAVQFDQSAFNAGTGTSPFTWTSAINVGAGANGTTNRTLWFGVSFHNAAPGVISAVSATHNGAAMTLVDNFHSTNNSDMFAFGIIAPATGSHDIVLSWTGSAGGALDLFALSVVGADQSAVATTFKNVAKNTATGTPATVTVTSATGDMVVAIHETSSNWGAGTTHSGTAIGFDDSGNFSGAAANYDNGAATVALTYTCSSAEFASMGMDIAAVGGGGGGGGFFARNYYDMIGRPNV